MDWINNLTGAGSTFTGSSQFSNNTGVGANSVSGPGTSTKKITNTTDDFLDKSENNVAPVGKIETPELKMSVAKPSEIGAGEQVDQKAKALQEDKDFITQEGTIDIEEPVQEGPTPVEISQEEDDIKKAEKKEEEDKKNLEEREKMYQEAQDISKWKTPEPAIDSEGKPIDTTKEEYLDMSDTAEGTDTTYSEIYNTMSNEEKKVLDLMNAKDKITALKEKNEENIAKGKENLEALRAKRDRNETISRLKTKEADAISNFKRQYAESISQAKSNLGSMTSSYTYAYGASGFGKSKALADGIASEIGKAETRVNNLEYELDSGLRQIEESYANQRQDLDTELFDTLSTEQLKLIGELEYLDSEANEGLSDEKKIEEANLLMQQYLEKTESQLTKSLDYYKLLNEQAEKEREEYKEWKEKENTIDDKWFEATGELRNENGGYFINEQTGEIITPNPEKELQGYQYLKDEGKVINFYKDGTTEVKNVLTPSQITTPSLEAMSIAKQVFTTGYENRAIEVQKMLDSGLSPREVTEKLKDTSTSGATKETRDIFNALSIGIGSSSYDRIKTGFYNTVNDYGINSDETKNYVLQVAKEKASADSANKVTGTEIALDALIDLKEKFENYYNAGGDTSLIKGTKEETENALGKVSDPELRRLGQEVALAVINFRQSKTGAGFSEEEAKAYERLYPSNKKDPELNMANIDGMSNAMKTYLNGFYRSKIGNKGYKEIFNEGAGQYIAGDESETYEGMSETDKKKSDIQDLKNRIKNETDPQKLEILNNILKKAESEGNAGNKKSKYMDEQFEGLNVPKQDFNKADQTAGTKDFNEKMKIERTGTNVAKDTLNPGNITADSIPSGETKESYGKKIGAIGTYKSPNGREYYVFGDEESGINALKRDLNAKMTGNSTVIKPNNTLEEFQRIYVGGVNPGYLQRLIVETGANKNTPIKDLDLDKLTQGVMKAEGFIK